MWLGSWEADLLWLLLKLEFREKKKRLVMMLHDTIVTIKKLPYGATYDSFIILWCDRHERWKNRPCSVTFSLIQLHAALSLTINDTQSWYFASGQQTVDSGMLRGVGSRQHKMVSFFIFWTFSNVLELRTFGSVAAEQWITLQPVTLFPFLSPFLQTEHRSHK